MKLTAVKFILILCAMFVFSSCSKNHFNSFWVGNNGNYVVRTHGPSIHFPWSQRHYGRRVRLRRHSGMIR